MIPVIKKECKEMKEACKAKNIKLNVSNMKICLWINVPELEL